MKKLLIATTAVAGLAMFATPAMAQGLSLDLGGFYRGYALNMDDDAPAAAGSFRDFNLRHDSEVYFTGEVTLDNGMTVGVHNEIDLGHEGAANTIFNDTTDETYAYFSGNWGRVNLGREDGAQYLLQVAAPSADSNVDGLRQYFGGFNSYAGDRLAGLIDFGTHAIAGGAGGALSGSINGLGQDYANDMGRYTNKITYFTPKFNGFQAGVSYAPEVTNGVQAINQNLHGQASDDDAGDFEDLWEVAARWDGEFNGVGLSFGAGYGHASTEVNAAAGAIGSDDRTQWNVAAAATWNQFSAGVVYKEDNHGITGAGAFDQEETWAFGLAWDNGPWHAGASYMNSDYEFQGATRDPELDRFTIGGGYEFGPGMSFRGAVAFGEYDNILAAPGAGDSRDFTQVTLGTEVNF